MIETNGLTKRYRKTLAVDGLTVSVPAGSVTGFLGPNGAGKTTTLRMLLGLVRPTSGEATIDGQPYRRLPRATSRVGAVLETSAFHPGRTGRNHLRTVATAAGLPPGRPDEVLAQVELDAAGRRRVGGYSLGMRQRLALAQALLGDPDVLILDEPANGLDPQGIRWLRDFLRGYAAGGRTVFVSSHVLSEIAQTADSVVIINRGKLVAHETLLDVQARATAGVRVRSPQAAQLRDALTARGIEATPVADDRFVVLAAAAADVGEIAAANGLVLHELTTESSSLEDVFLELTGESKPR